MLSEVHEEGAKSGSGENITDREVLTNVLSLINQGEIKHLYVYHQDRLSEILTFQRELIMTFKRME